jgi:hypothetical protein
VSYLESTVPRRCSSVINDRELLAALIRLIIRVVEREGFRGLWTAKGTRDHRYYCQNRKDPFG